MASGMKLYSHALAPNPRRVRIFAAERGIELAVQDIDILAGQSRRPEFLAKNPSDGVPVLELDDGSYLAESVAICRYLEGLHPEPNLFGRDLREQAQIEMWNRRMELELFAAIGRTVQNTSPIFQGRSAACGRPSTTRTDGSRAERTAVVAGDRFTIADITALVAIDIGGRLIHFFRLLLVFWRDHRHRTGFQSCWPIDGHSERGLQAAWSAPPHCPAQVRPSPSEIPRIRTARTPGDSDSRHRRNCATGGGCGAVP